MDQGNHELVLVSCGSGRIDLEEAMKPVVRFLERYLLENTSVYTGILNDEEPGVARVVAQALKAERRELTELHLGFRHIGVNDVADTIITLANNQRDIVVLLGQSAEEIMEAVVRKLGASMLRPPRQIGDSVLLTLNHGKLLEIGYFFG